MDDIEKMNRHNKIFKMRTEGITAISAEDAIDWGFTGPTLRAAGVPYDVRKWFPNYDYDKFEFDIPVGERGDVYDRYLVRIEEIRQSLRIIKQAIENLPEGPWQIDDRRISLPPKKGVYSNIEDLMNHFELIQDGILPPIGEVYSYWEAANGELGFYLVSDGSKASVPPALPWRMLLHFPGVQPHGEGRLPFRCRRGARFVEYRRR